MTRGYQSRDIGRLLAVDNILDTETWFTSDKKCIVDITKDPKGTLFMNEAGTKGE